MPRSAQAQLWALAAGREIVELAWSLRRGSADGRARGLGLGRGPAQEVVYGTRVPIDVVCVGAIHVHAMRALHTAAVEGTQQTRALERRALTRFWYIKDANSAWACKRTPSQEEME